MFRIKSSLSLVGILVSVLFVSTQAQADPFLPPQGKVLVMVGQDKETIDQYVQSTGHVPAGLMIYTSVQEVSGLTEPKDFGANIQYGQYLVDKYPDSVLQIGLYMVGALEDTISGKYDDAIAKLGTWIKATKRPVYLRIGYEFDLPENGYDPVLYQKAYRYIVDYLRQQSVDNIAYVWHSHGYFFPEKPMMDWYPGDDYVDWFAVSFFKPFNQGNVNFIAKRAQEHGKPFMIAESTPFGTGTGKGEKSWNMWFKIFFESIERYHVKAVCYINSDWESQSMFKGKGWGDARIQANDWIKERWLKEISRSQFMHATPSLFKNLNYYGQEK